jgi:NAD(P)-dependent dehydrogenase (short-subunit alcohol dehydrogenase family)
MSLPSLREGYRAVVFGASGGLGAALVRQLAADPRCAVVHAGARTPGPPAERTRPFAFDLNDEEGLAEAAGAVAAGGPLDLVMVATGVLHGEGLAPEKTYRSLNADAFARTFAINATGPALIARHMLPVLSRESKSVFAALSARVGSISDNRSGGWHAYRASKAALNQIIRTCAIELAARNRLALCVALHPGTVDTGLSKPFQSGVSADRLFSPYDSGAHLLGVIDRLGPADSGGFFAWDGSPIPY